MTPSPGSSSVARTIVPFVLLGLVEILLFFRDAAHFFTADTLIWMGSRHRSAGEFLLGFVQVDPGYWYRPLAQRTVESVLFPVFELNPLPYRLIGFVLFFLCTIGVYLVAERLTNSRRIAWFTVLIFTPHLIHTFPTYDTSFTPELVFTLFYIGSVLLYIQYLQTEKRTALFASAALFVGGLLSKEAAVALPFTLGVVWLLFPREKRGSVRSLLPHFAVLGLYLAFAIGYLHVRQLDFEDFLRPADSASPEYAFGPGRHILTNLTASANWVFGIPQGTYGHWTFEHHRMPMALEIGRTLAILGAICVLFTRRRQFVVLGIAWFLTTAIPAFLLIHHFLPYYLFAPLIGLALALGTILDWGCAQCLKIFPRAGFAVPVGLLLVWTVIHASTGRRIADKHEILGAATRVLEGTVEGIRALYPTLPEGTHVVFFHEDIPSTLRDPVGIGLQLAYDDPTLTTHFVAEGFFIPVEEWKTGRTLVFKLKEGRIADMTEFVTAADGW